MDEKYAEFYDAISDFRVSTADGVIFQADTGSLEWSNFMGRGDVRISTNDSENPLDNASLNLRLDWKALLTKGQFTNKLEEFRVPGHGGSIAWDIEGTITQVPEPSTLSLVPLALLATLLRCRRQR